MAAAVVLGLVIVAGSSAVFGLFRSETTNGGNVVSAAPDWMPPDVRAATAEKFQGGIPGYVGGTRSLYVYAQLTDSGNPASGIASADALVGTPTPRSLALSSGSWTVGGNSYNYRTASQTLGAGEVVTGSNAFSVSALDQLGNRGSTSGFSFVYDALLPQSAGVALVNGGSSTSGMPDSGDQIVYSFNEPADPSSLIGDWSAAVDQRFPESWNGSSRTVRVQFAAQGGVGDNARVTLLDGPSGSTAINLGRVDLMADQWRMVRCTATFNSSTITMAGDNRSATVTLGTLSPSGAIAAAAATPQACS